MSRELIIKAWCDRCQALGQDRAEALHTYTIGFVKGETRPAPRVIELCDECDGAIDWLPKLLADFSIPLDPKAPAVPARSTPVVSVATDRVECRVCGSALAKAAIVAHVWSQHRPGESKPRQPAVCPECRGQYGQGMGMHRSQMHGHTSLDEAYRGLI